MFLVLENPCRIENHFVFMVRFLFMKFFCSWPSEAAVIAERFFDMITGLRKVTIYLLISCNTEERIAQNIYIHNSNKNYKKLTTTTVSIKKRIGIGYKNYKKQCPELEFRLIPKLISWAGSKPKKFLKIPLG